MRSLVAGMVLLALPAIASAQTVSKPDLTGKWLFTVTTDAGSGTPTVTLKQQGDTLTGHYSSQLLGEVDLKGTVKDQTFRFTISTTIQETTVVVTYAGTRDGNDGLKGTVDFGGMGSGSFTAKRQP
jgi:hypothetical protein